MGIFRRPQRTPDPAGAERTGHAAAPAAPVRLEETDLRATLEPLPPGLRESLWAGRRPCIRFATRAASGRAAPSGCRLGGAALLPVGTKWPTWRGPAGKGPSRPLTLWAHIDLAQTARHLDLDLPNEGSLLLFADFDHDGLSDGITGLYQDELLGARVLHVPADQPVTPVKSPAGVQALPPADLLPMLTVTWPDLDAELADDEYDAYDDADQALEQLLRRTAPAGWSVAGRHQLGGNARFIQHPVEQEVVQAAHDVYSRSGGFDHQRWEQVKNEVSRWRLLLQIDSDDSLDLMFGDVGTVYWAAPAQDIAAHDFTASRFNFQCS